MHIVKSDSWKTLFQPLCGAAIASSIALIYPLKGLAQESSGLDFFRDIQSSSTPSTPTESRRAANQASQFQLLDTAYILGAGDIVDVQVFESPEYSGEKQVLSDGSLNLPLVGRVSVQGKTLEAAAEAISQQYASLLRRPIINLSLITPRPVRVGVAGEVESPGSYVISPTDDDAGPDALPTLDNLPTLTEALRLAGGITLASDLSNVELRRNTPNGVQQVVNLNLWNLVQSGDLSEDITLRDGDSIFIPTDTQLDPIESRQLVGANLYDSTAQPLNVAVVGEVLRPGTHTLIEDARENNTVTRAIQLAGGITQSADIRSVKIRRLATDGSERDIDINLWQLLEDGDLSQDVILQEGDTVIIPTATEILPAEATELASASFSPELIQVYIVGEVNTPGLVEVPPNTPLNQAILAAGGFDSSRANRRNVELIRLNDDGTVARRDISVDLSANINDETNPILRRNDVVAVGRSGLASFSDSAALVTDPIGRFFSLFNIFNVIDGLLD